MLYSNLTNQFSRDQVFYGVVSTFIAFFALFAFLIYPNMDFPAPARLRRHADGGFLPAGFAAPLAIIRNWTFAVFYTMAELWGSVVVSLMFWGFANEVTTVPGGGQVLPALRPRRQRGPHLLGAVRAVRLGAASRAAPAAGAAVDDLVGPVAQAADGRRRRRRPRASSAASVTCRRRHRGPTPSAWTRWR